MLLLLRRDAKACERVASSGEPKARHPKDPPQVVLPFLAICVRYRRRGC
jgi:hypothetical protein